MLRHLRISGLWKWYGKTAFGHLLERLLTACFLVASLIPDRFDIDVEFPEESSPSPSRLRNCWSSGSVKNQRKTKMTY